MESRIIPRIKKSNINNILHLCASIGMGWVYYVGDDRSGFRRRNFKSRLKKSIIVSTTVFSSILSIRLFVAGYEYSGFVLILGLLCCYYKYEEQKNRRRL